MTQAPGVDLYWLPLGAGGHFVSFNGRVFEAIAARRAHRKRLELYHTALVVTCDDTRFVIENAWPIPDPLGEARGVVLEGAVFGRSLGRLRVFRYEVRRWREGVIADISHGTPARVSDDKDIATRVLALVDHVPNLTWGRTPDGACEMWNSNSVVSWLLASSGLEMEEISPPAGGLAPGWSTGIRLAETSMPELQNVAV